MLDSEFSKVFPFRESHFGGVGRIFIIQSDKMQCPVNHVQKKFVLHRAADLGGHVRRRIRADNQLASEKTRFFVVIENETDHICFVIVIQILFIELSNRRIVNDCDAEF